MPAALGPLSGSRVGGFFASIGIFGVRFIEATRRCEGSIFMLAFGDASGLACRALDCRLGQNHIQNESTSFF